MVPGPLVSPAIVVCGCKLTLTHSSYWSISMTRRFSNHETRLLLQSHTCMCNHCIIRFDPIKAVTVRKRSLIPRWPLTPRLLRSHVWLYPRIIVYKSWKYIKVCGYSDPFAKTLTKGHWPLDDLWPHIWWGHMCDSTQGSLCPNPMGIHQCMWIQ